jgi:GT2 family glycosyltransferase
MEAEVIVVDNNSVDGSVEMVKQKFPAVRVMANRENTGFSKANNQGIRESKGEYVLLLNPDTIVEEDTFGKCIGFMDAHPQAGALGVKMMDGSGNFLPESKRGLPTPAVAFYKMSGLSALFPRSATFGRYHLGFLDQDRIHEVDVLAGAFMLLRRSALDKTGLLDEDYFMYGEDIDLSYRMTKAGYKNYYFPETRIIHYKGESTKKTSVNYVRVFYNAMNIFALKHFSKKNAALFSFFISIAIYIRAGVAILIRFLRKALLPATDMLLLYAGIYFLKEYWSTNMDVHYPDIFMFIAVPVYIFTWIVSVYFSGGYDRPVRLQKIIRGVVTGTVIILVFYALLPEMYRFSRALILIGAVLAMTLMVITRLLLNLSGMKLLASDARKRLLIVGEEDEASRVLSLLKMSDTSHNFIGVVTVENSKFKAHASTSLSMTSRNFTQNEIENVTQSEVEGLNAPSTLNYMSAYNLGGAENLKEIAEVYKADEIIFCARDVASNSIINYMSAITSKDVEFKIAPPESLFIIGSSSANSSGDLYVIDINSISRRVNRRNKRMLDIMLSLLFLLLSPLLIFIQKRPSRFFPNLFGVLSGMRSLVGYHYKNTSIATLPKIRRGILNPVDVLNQSLDEITVSRLNALYAKDYHVYTDIDIIRKGIRYLGQ